MISDIITQTTIGKDANGNYTTASVKEFLELLIATLKSGSVPNLGMSILKEIEHKNKVFQGNKINDKRIKLHIYR